MASTPNILFIPRTSIPMASRMDLRWSFWMDGTHVQSLPHHVPNHLLFGPDGWLYGCLGYGSNSLVGVPGSSPDQRVGSWMLQRFGDCIRNRKNSKSWRVELATPGASTSTPAESSSLRTTCWLTCGRYCPEADTNVGKSMTTTPILRNLIDRLHRPQPLVGLLDDWRIDPGKTRAAGGGHAHAGLMIYQGDNFARYVSRGGFPVQLARQLRHF